MGGLFWGLFVYVVVLIYVCTRSCSVSAEYWACYEYTITVTGCTLISRYNVRSGVLLRVF